MASSVHAAQPRTPIVLFPGYSTNKLLVTVSNQTEFPDCPGSGTFEDGLAGDPGPFSQVCRDQLLTLHYDRRSGAPMPQRFSRPTGVRVGFVDYGKTSSAPFYAPFFSALEQAGYTADADIRVANYNFRLTPDMDGFLQRTRALIRQTSIANGRRPVRLVGHSEGPVYAQYLLTHVSPAWKRRYIQGFTAIAGNFPGQGAAYTWLFTGLNVTSFTFPTTPENALSSARLSQSSPATYLSAADPAVFGNREVVVLDTQTGKSYTPRHQGQLLEDAGLSWAKPIADYYLGFVKFADRKHFPHVDVSAEKGSGIPTQVGVVLPNLAIGQVLDQSAPPFLYRDGDINQEDITNDAVRVWRTMRCHRFRLTDNPGVNHYQLPSDAHIVARLLVDLDQRPSRCP